RPVKTRMVSCCSCGVSVAQDCTSLDSGTFSGSQKLPVSRFHTSRSFSSWMRFQLIAWTAVSSLTPSVMVGLFFWIGFRFDSLRSLSGRWSEHAADAALDLGAFEGELAQPDVVDGLDALLPR